MTNVNHVETFGSPDVYSVRLGGHGMDPEVFAFQPEVVEDNITAQ